jgi:hypothetical protein
MTIEMFPPRAESVDSFSLQPAIDLRPAGTSAGDSPKPVRGLSRRLALAGLAMLPVIGNPRAAAPPAAPTPDAELIKLGARFEPLVDRYYVAQRRWSRSLAAASAERDRKFPDADAAERYHSPDIAAAFKDSCERWDFDEASDALHAIFKEMAPLANAINAAAVSSIEGFRAKALVAFWEVAPLCAGDLEFSFDDAWPFQQLFTAVAELCGLTGKVAATGYELPDIGIVEAAPDDDADDDGEEA